MHQLSRTLHEPGAAEAITLRRWLPRHIAVFDLSAANRREREPSDREVPLPASWMSGWTGQRAPNSLLLFVDGSPVHYYYGDPEQPARTPYGYFRSARARSLVIRCPPSAPCAQAVIVLYDATLAATLATGRLVRHAAHLLLLLSGLALSALVVISVPPPWSTTRSVVCAAVVGALWIGGRLYATAWSAPLLTLEALALSAPAWASSLRSLRHEIGRLWQRAVSPAADRVTWALRLLFITAASCAAGLPHALAGRSWYPSETEDSLFYLFASSRFLAEGSFVRGLLTPSAWLYSAFPAAVAGISAAAGTHPMVTYRVLGYVGAALLPAAAGVFAYSVTGRLRVAATACVVAGMWGGLAGYLWLISDALPALVHGRAALPLQSDYFEPRFLGEFTGPHSEVTAYLCDVPLYPREAALVLFWPALGLVYAGLPSPRPWRLALFAALGVCSTALYPYYGIPAIIVVAFVGVSTAVLAARQGRWLLVILTMATVGAAAAAIVVIADLLLAQYQGVATMAFGRRLLGYVADLWANARDRRHRSLEFNPLRIASGHFFMAAALVSASLSRSDASGGSRWRTVRRLVRSWPGTALFTVGLTMTALVGWAGVALPRAYSVLVLYSWIVLWRALVSPVLITATAAAVVHILERLERQRRPTLAAAVLLVPCLSPTIWMVSSDLIRRSPATANRYARARALYKEYAAHGRRLLGAVHLREPVLIEGAPVGAGDFAQAAFGVRAAESRKGGLAPDVSSTDLASLFQRDREAALLARMAAGQIGDVAALRHGEAATRLLRSGACVAVAEFGPYVVLRLAARTTPRGPVGGSDHSAEGV